MANDAFYAELPAFSDFAGVADAQQYHRAPDDWWVVITDVRGSTKAIEAGRYKQVNALGVACIVTALRVAKNVEVPYVFGGDGATLIVPPSLEGPLRDALSALSGMATRLFDLGLRVGFVQVRELRERGGEVLVARYLASEHIALAQLAGGGPELAEKLIKDEANGARYRVEPREGQHAQALLEGFECRWNPIPSRQGSMVSLLVVPTHEDEAERGRAVRQVLALLAGFDEGAARPASVKTLQLARSAKLLDIESRLRTGQRGGFRLFWYRLKAWLVTQIGRLLVATKQEAGGFHGEVYPRQVVANTDFRKFDGALRMVLDLTAEQQRALEAHLHEAHGAGLLAWGLHAAPAALMTCFVPSYDGAHVHFVDGADGGYALAAKQLKEQLKKK